MPTASRAAATFGPVVPSPRPTSAGSADLQFSDGYVEHIVATLEAGDTCDPAFPSDGATAAVHGFRIASKASSPEEWTLTLDDITGTWTLGLAFATSAQDLYWFEGSDAGSVTATAAGFEIEVTMTGVSKVVRIQGSVTCG